MAEMSFINVLVLAPTRRTHFSISNLPKEVSKMYKFFLHCPKPIRGGSGGVPSLQDCLQDARDVIVRENINIVFVHANDCAALVKAALVEEFPHLRGPSLESTFLGYNKYYTRCYLDPQPIPFASLDLSLDSLDQACKEALQTTGVPAFFKPSCLSGSMGVVHITSIRELNKESQLLLNSTVFTDRQKYVEQFLAQNIDKSKYPLASLPTATVEKYMGGAFIVNADGYVFDGKIFHWSLSDNIYSQVKPNYIIGTADPTTLPESMQKEVWKVFDGIVQKMIEYGFDNEFVNIELFVLSSGELRLMEVNSRRGGNMLASTQVFKNGNVTIAQLMLAQGMNPDPPERNGCHVFYSYIKTYGSGRAREFYDYTCTDPAIILEHEPDHIIDGSGENGALLARMVLSGDSRKEIMQKHRSVCERVLLKPELSVWE